MRMHALRHTTAALALFTLCSVMGSACDDSDSPDEDAADMATIDAADMLADTEDTALPDTVEDTSDDTSDVVPRSRLGGESCTESIECQRRLICDRGTCASWVGCAFGGGLFPDEGCILGEGGGVYSAIECEDDADCATSSDGPYCIRRTCHAQPPCTTDTECAAGESCYAEQICLPSS